MVNDAYCCDDDWDDCSCNCSCGGIVLKYWNDVKYWNDEKRCPTNHYLLLYLGLLLFPVPSLAHNYWIARLEEWLRIECNVKREGTGRREMVCFIS